MNELRQLEANLARIGERIRGALRRSGDPDRKVTVIGVTKGAPPETVDALAAIGVSEIGENRVQEALAKAPLVRRSVRWHMIGHLQRNKARKAAALFSVVHSVDSIELLRVLAAAGRPLEVFLQVNISGEASKEGVAPERIRPLWQEALRSDPLRVAGLMTIAPYAEDPETARPVFRALRQLRDDLSRAGDGPAPAFLSMGMSGDYEVAVEEGATHLRIGTALVGPIRRPAV